MLLGSGKKINKEIIGVAIVLVGILATISLFSAKTGIIGFILKNILFTFFGFGAYVFPILIIISGLLLNFNKTTNNKVQKIIHLFTIFLVFIAFIHIKGYGSSGFSINLSNVLNLSKEGLGGGILGSILAYIFLKLFGTVGSYIIFSFILLITIFSLTNLKLRDIFNSVKLFVTKKLKKQKIKQSIKEVPKEAKKKIPKKNNKKIQIFHYVESEKDKKQASENFAKNTVLEVVSKTSHEGSTNFNYKFPSTNLLKKIEKCDVEDKKEILSNASKIEATMENFGVNANITQINKGPTITCYELQPAPGVKVSRIVNLSDDLALSLASSDIRIEAPIPGKAAVGIEVPNKIKNNVGLRELLESKEFHSLDNKLPLVLGKDISGKPIISSIDKMPHLLIAGATGSGKSVCINTIIMSILFKAYPHEVKLLLIDPKVVELSIYNGIPHLLIPVVTDPKKAASALKWAVEEMERRYKIFAESNVRDIESYNKKYNQELDKKLPKLLIIIDELADLMMVAAQEIEDYICRLAQMARAAGIHLIIATQRPSVDVITGVIKANIPSRISFQVASQVDSRTILDIAGAEKLLGQGDMLFYPSSSSRPIRVQGAFVSDNEVEKVVEYLKNLDLTKYNETVLEKIDNSSTSSPKARDNLDDLFYDAVKIVTQEGQASISLLQRRLRIGYARAARIVDEMEAQGIIGGFQGSKPREVLVSKEELETVLRGE